MIVLTVFVWSQGGKEVPPESPMRLADMAGRSVTLTPSFSALRISCFPFSRCVTRCLCFVIFSAPSCFSSGIVPCPVLFCTSLICFRLLYCALYCSVVLSSIKQGDMSLYWQLILCVRLCPRRFFSRGSFRNRNTELKVQADEYSTSKYRQPGRQKNGDFNKTTTRHKCFAVHPSTGQRKCLYSTTKVSYSPNRGVLMGLETWENLTIVKTLVSSLLALNYIIVYY